MLHTSAISLRLGPSSSLAEIGWNGSTSLVAKVNVAICCHKSVNETDSMSKFINVYHQKVQKSVRVVQWCCATYCCCTSVHNCAFDLTDSWSLCDSKSANCDGSPWCLGMIQARRCLRVRYSMLLPGSHFEKRFPSCRSMPTRCGFLRSFHVDQTVVWHGRVSQRRASRPCLVDV